MHELRQDLEEGLSLLEAVSQPGAITPKFKARISRLSMEGGAGGAAAGWVSHETMINTCSSTDSLLSPVHGARYSLGAAVGPFGHHVARCLSLPDNLRRQLRRSRSWQGREEKVSTALFDNSLFDPAASGEAAGELAMPVLKPAMSQWQSLKDGASLPILSCYKNAAFEDDGLGTGTLTEEENQRKQSFQSQQQADGGMLVPLAAAEIEAGLLPTGFNQLAEKPLLGFNKAASDTDSEDSTMRIKAAYTSVSADGGEPDPQDEDVDLEGVIVLQRRLDFSDDGGDSTLVSEDSIEGGPCKTCRATAAEACISLP